MENLDFNKCPVCGDEDTVSVTLSKEGQAKGDLAENQFISLFGVQAVISDPNKAKLLTPTRPVPIVTILFDVCSKCGVMFARKVETKEGVVQTQPNPSRPVAQNPFRRN